MKTSRLQLPPGIGELAWSCSSPFSAILTDCAFLYIYSTSYSLATLHRTVTLIFKLQGCSDSMRRLRMWISRRCIRRAHWNMRKGTSALVWRLEGDGGLPSVYRPQTYSIQRRYLDDR